MNEKRIGAPTKYRPEYNDEARQVCLLTGATDADLAAHFGVAESTIKEWYKKHPDFSASVKAGKMGADMQVAEGFFKRASGYDYTETTFEKIDGKLALESTPDEAITQEPYKKKIVTKHLAADPGAALNWLKNRQPLHWRDKVEVHHSGEIKSGELSHLSDEELRARLAELQQHDDSPRP